MGLDAPNIVVVGAGIGGLTTAALLSRAGLPVTVLEAHVYPGGCAGTFYHQGFRFDAGATLAGGFYPGGPMDIVARAVGISSWSAKPTKEALTVRLPDGAEVVRYGDDRRWAERARHFGARAESFWRWQERTADLLWDLALRCPPWPPQSVSETRSLVGSGLGWLFTQSPRNLRPALLADMARPLSAHLSGQSEELRLFIDAQLLIAAQTTSDRANALYGASALDLPRRGVVHLAGGMGGLAQTLAETIQSNGGAVHYRQQVDGIVMEQNRPAAVVTKRGEIFDADAVIVNLPPWHVSQLLGKAGPAKLRNASPYPQDGWGAFTVYAGIDESALSDSLPHHYQLIQRRPLAETNTLFTSISPKWDTGRAPQGHRAITFSTHTTLQPWWDLYASDRSRYEERRQDYLNRTLDAAERVIPDIRQATTVLLPGTPVTFQRFTRRQFGWVGGYPQTSLFRTQGPKIGPGVWMVGDSIFPGQSTAAVALGGLRVARSVLSDLGVPAQEVEPIGSAEPVGLGATTISS